MAHGFIQSHESSHWSQVAASCVPVPRQNRIRNPATTSSRLAARPRSRLDRAPAQAASGALQPASRPSGPWTRFEHVNPRATSSDKLFSYPFQSPPLLPGPSETSADVAPPSAHAVALGRRRATRATLITLPNPLRPVELELEQPSSAACQRATSATGLDG